MDVGDLEAWTGVSQGTALWDTSQRAPQCPQAARKVLDPQGT